MPAEPWTFVAEPVTLERPGGLVTLVEGATFSLSDRVGDISPGGPVGVFVLDSRVVSRWRLLVDGEPLEPLSVNVSEPYAATFVGRARPGGNEGESTLLAVRRRWVGSGLREDVELRNYSETSVTAVVELQVVSDFADLFDVKSGRATDAAFLRRHPDELRTSATYEGVRREVVVTEHSEWPLGTVGPEGLTWTIELPPGGTWQTCLELVVSVDGHDLALQYRCGQSPAASKPTLRLAGWRKHAPLLPGSDRRLVRAISRAVDDIGSLIIEDPRHPESPVVAAGAPWFMALFGRDSLLTSYMSLIVDPALAVGVLQTLARLQGVKVDGDTEEQPGRILHEVRFNSSAATDFDDGHIYYGTVDATPLFVVLVGELSRWGVDRAVVESLLPHVDRALEWISEYGDKDGDGYVEYERLSPTGLANQGWKDSWDGVSDARGRLAQTPIALAEVQGYVYAAYLARAALARERSDSDTARRYDALAEKLRVAFNRDFWVPERSWYAMALDGRKQPVDALASNIGHCLWSGIVDPQRAASVAAQLVSPQMSTGWGLRTLASSMPRYDPLSYHNGSVWPHDSALAAAGLMRYGFVDESARLIDGVLDAAEANGGRLPELYAGLGRDDVGVPVAYPTSCSPQAWASAAPLLMLRTLLRLEPRVDLGHVAVDPVTDGGVVGDVDLQFAGGRLVIRSGAGGVDVRGLPVGVVAESGPRRPRSAHVAPN